MSKDKNTRAVWTVKVRTLVRPIVWQFRQALWERLGDRSKNVASLYHNKLSLFFNPRELNASNSRLILRQPVDLVIATCIPNAAPIAVFDFLDRPADPQMIERKKGFLEPRGIKYWSITPAQMSGKESNRIIDDVLDLVQRGLGPMVHRRAVHEKQRRVVEATVSLASKYSLVCIHEPSLDSLFTVDEEWISNMRKKFGYEHVRKYFHHETSDDAVIATAPPNSRPLVGVEFDGRDHREKLDMIQKDQVKNEIFRAAGIPLIRIDSRDFGKWESMWDVSAREIFLGLLGAHLGEVAKNKRSEHQSGKNSQLREHVEYLPNISTKSHSWVSVLTMSLNNNGMLPPPDDEVDEALPESVRWKIEVARENPEYWPIPPGFQQQFKEKENKEEKQLEVTLVLRPGRYLRLGGWESEVNASVSLRLDVVAEADDTKICRELAFNFLRILSVAKVRKELADKRNKLLDHYSCGIKFSGAPTD